MLRLSLAVVTLVAVGAAAALLLAPKCGAEDREDGADISARSQDMVSEGGPAVA